FTPTHPRAVPLEPAPGTRQARAGAAMPRPCGRLGGMTSSPTSRPSLPPAGSPPDDDELIVAFTEWAAARRLELYPHQEEALLEIVTGAHVIASTPTGSGKSLIAVAAHAVALARGQRSVYTAPLKALVSEKFFDLVEVFGAEN